MGMDAYLCTLSPKRLEMLEDDEQILNELLEAGQEEPIPGLLALGKTWHALDLILGGSADSCLGDVILARSGVEFDVPEGLERARVLAPPRVRLVAQAVGSLAADLVRTRYPKLYGVEVHGRFGQEHAEPGDSAYLQKKVEQQQEAEIRELQAMLAKVVSLYADAAAARHSMLSVLG